MWWRSQDSCFVSCFHHTCSQNSSKAFGIESLLPRLANSASLTTVGGSYGFVSTGVGYNLNLQFSSIPSTCNVVYLLIVFVIHYQMWHLSLAESISMCLVVPSFTFSTFTCWQSLINHHSLSLWSFSWCLSCTQATQAHKYMTVSSGSMLLQCGHVWFSHTGIGSDSCTQLLIIVLSFHRSWRYTPY